MEKKENFHKKIYFFLETAADVYKKQAIFGIPVKVQKNEGFDFSNYRYPNKEKVTLVHKFLPDAYGWMSGITIIKFCR